MELGKTVCKTSSGYSLLHLMIGSEGPLGIITELTLKLIPKPNMDVSLILPFADVETAIASVPVSYTHLTANTIRRSSARSRAPRKSRR